ncbi:MAG: hypothetical protein WDN04_07225 [Rhodospirillales bacterium]
MVLNPDDLTAATRAALAQLRAPGSLHWATVYLLILTGYLYSSEIHAGRLRVAAAGAAVWFADWINEILNSGVLHWTGVAALWTETGSTFYQVTVGLNAESTFLFAVYGMTYAKMLPADRNARILGMNNRLVVAMALSAASVFVEVILTRAGIFHWHYWFWNVPYGLPVIFFAGYVWFFLAAAWAHDAPTDTVAVQRVGALGGVALLLGVVFALAGWL